MAAYPMPHSTCHMGIIYFRIMNLWKLLAFHATCGTLLVAFGMSLILRDTFFHFDQGGSPLSAIYGVGRSTLAAGSDS